MGQQDVGDPKDSKLWDKICVNFKHLGDLHKRERPLGEPPSVGQSILAIIRTSCEPLILWHLHLHLTLRWSDLGLNVLLIFIPLSVSVLERRSCSIVPLITLLVDIPLRQARQYPDIRLLVHPHDAFPSNVTSKSACSLFPCYCSPRKGVY